MSADLDIFILAACSEYTCLTFGNNEVTVTDPGSNPYYLVVDGHAGAIPPTNTPQPLTASPLPTASASPVAPTETPLPGILGDIDDDGRITSADALLCFQIALGIYLPTPEEAARADADQDGQVTSADALCIFQEALGIPNDCFG